MNDVILFHEEGKGGGGVLPRLRSLTRNTAPPLLPISRFCNPLDIKEPVKRTAIDPPMCGNSGRLGLNADNSAHGNGGWL